MTATSGAEVFFFDMMLHHFLRTALLAKVFSFSPGPAYNGASINFFRAQSKKPERG